MRTTALSAAALSLLLAAPGLAQDGPPFFGPELHAGAWEVTRAWSDPAAGSDDRSRGSLAWAYREWAPARADEHVAAGTELDCADLSIELVVEYAARNGLPLAWRVWYAPEHRFVTIKSTDRQFASPEQFAAWSRWYLGAMNLADNTYAIGYEEWAGGDMVLMDWNQTDVEPNFPGRTVWHTYLIGEPDRAIYYGNISGGVALPVTRTESPTTLERVRQHPDRHGSSPRRFTFLRGALGGTEVKKEEAVVRTLALNLRAGPGTTFPVLARGLAGQRLELLARDGLWAQLRGADGRLVWAHSGYLRVETTWRPAPVAPAPVDTAPVVVASPVMPTPGLVSALPGN